ncbi:Excinuclease ABC subunit B [Slackia heliotrinireducens DSM 20476]|uniref:UvrABC system protein B n=1 Tax=Slackia heliotrinireducens (strain ATCC 29202 / DSM 20476 / NCTC 11029 / RHS 1) TaxID=471855 RepID=C7N7X4_SLAHD|nr:Excinuclease ABC subunit B [Slackia heliotrinireducens DSM 20476]
MANQPFKVVAPYEPSGDQPQAIEKLAEGIESGLRYQTLLGVTGSGKTFTMAKTIEAIQRPTLVMAPNKTLAAQLAAELKEFFPNNAVVYFVSYYDYYQPEAYVPQTDTFIEKDASINEEVEKLRHAATSSLLSRRDIIVVASVSCIYGIGSPMDYAGMAVFVDKEVPQDRDDVIYKLIDIQYDRNDYELKRGTFRVRGDALDVFPPYADNPVRIEFWGDEIERISEIDNVTGEVLGSYEALPIWPASHYVTARPKMDKALNTIQDELRERLQQFKDEGKLLEAQRLEMRVNYDLEMLETMGFCSGIENYSRHLDGREPGEPPYTLIDYFPDDFVCIIDESHVTVPQIRGMHEGDRSRKVTLAEHGFRLPSCLDNRPLRFDEFEDRIPQFIYVSATPGDYEEKVTQQQVEQIIRPTGLLDPEIEVRPIASQIDDVIDEAKERGERNERVLITTLTKKMAEDLTDHLLDRGIKARYMHSDIGTLERVEILRDLRKGEFDVLVGINLLREGLDLPEVSLVAILDADKEGFLRNHRSLIQTIGRAARNVSGKVIMYADKLTDSMNLAITETRRRRAVQMQYNEEHGIEPQTIRKAINDVMGFITDADGNEVGDSVEVNKVLAEMSRAEVMRVISSMEEEMAAASVNMDFEEAARLRDQVVKLRAQVEGSDERDILADLKKSARKGSAFGNRKNSAYGSSRRS